MKISEITTNNVADYLKLDYANMTASEKSELDTIISVAKSFIGSYTGIYERTVIGKLIGTGNGDTSDFKTCYPMIPDTVKVYSDAVELVSNTDYRIIYPSTIQFITPPVRGAIISIDYNSGLDAFDDFIIVLYVLCQDMHDNRSMYVDKTNLNRVVDTILGLHSINLL